MPFPQPRWFFVAGTIDNPFPALHPESTVVSGPWVQYFALGPRGLESQPGTPPDRIAHCPNAKHNSSPASCPATQPMRFRRRALDRNTEYEQTPPHL